MSKNKLRAVSTDGHRLLMIDFPFKCDQKFAALISRVNVIRIIRSAKLHRHECPPGPLCSVELVLHDQDVIYTLKVTIGIVALTIPCVNAEFPLYEQVLPEPLKLDSEDMRKTEECVALQTKYLADAHLINTRLGNTDTHGVEIQVGEAWSDAVRFDFATKDGIKATMILMPMRFK